MTTYEEFAKRGRDYNAEIYGVFGQDGDRVKEGVRATDPLIPEGEVEEYIANLIPDVIQHMQPAEHKDLADAAINFHENMLKQIEGSDDPDYGGIFSKSEREQRKIVAKALEILQEQRLRNAESRQMSTPTEVSRAQRQGSSRRWREQNRMK